MSNHNIDVYKELTEVICQSNELRHEKTNILVSDLVRHKPGLAATEDG